MKIKKILTVIIAIAVLLPTAIIPVYADNIIPIMPVNDSPEQIDNEPQYDFIDGVITDIKDFLDADGNPVEGKQIVKVEKGEAEWNIIPTADTYFINVGRTDRKAMSVGDDIKVFYNSKAPMIMIYPPQITAEFIALNFDEAKFITIARFYEKFVDSRNSLRLNISDTAEIIYQDGKKFEGEISELAGRKIIVIYSATTRSIPPQTSPETIIVMYEKAVHPGYMLTEEEKASIENILESNDIVFNNIVIEGAKAYIDENGTLMIPIRAIAEKIGYEVTWIHETRTVNMGRSLSFSIGKDEYNFNSHDPMSLGISPVLVNDKTYVPISLFENMPFGKVIVRYHFTDDTINIEIHIPQIQ